MYAEQASSVNLLVVQNMDGLNHDHAGSSYWIPLKMHGVHPYLSFSGALSTTSRGQLRLCECWEFYS